MDYGFTSPGEWTSVDGPTVGHIARNFTADGQLSGWDQPNGGKTGYTYDRGRLDTQTDEAGRKTQYTYDDLNRVIRQTDLATGAYGSFDYDLLNRVTDSYAADGAHSHTHYHYTGDGAFVPGIPLGVPIPLATLTDLANACALEEATIRDCILVSA